MDQTGSIYSSLLSSESGWFRMLTSSFSRAKLQWLHHTGLLWLFVTHSLYTSYFGLTAASLPHSSNCFLISLPRDVQPWPYYPSWSMWFIVLGSETCKLSHLLGLNQRNQSPPLTVFVGQSRPEALSPKTIMEAAALFKSSFSFFLPNTQFNLTPTWCYVC